MSIGNFIGFGVTNAFIDNAVYNTPEALYFLGLEKYPVPIGITTISGGNILNGATKVVDSVAYKYHTFTENGTLLVGTNTSVDVLLVGAGGNGAFSGLDGNPGSLVQRNGGGGGGGVLLLENVTLGRGSYTVEIGKKTDANSDQTGGNTRLIYQSVEILKALGGGHGGSSLSNINSYSGGSGGGTNTGGGAGGGLQPVQSFDTFPQYNPAVTLNAGSPGDANGGGGGAKLVIESPIPVPALPGNAVGVAGTVPTDDFNDFYGDTIGLPGLNPTNGRFGAGGGGGLGYGTVPGPDANTAQVANAGVGGGGGGARVFSSPPTPGPQGSTRPGTPYSFASSNAVENSGGGGGGGCGPAPRAGTRGADGVLVIRYAL